MMPTGCLRCAAGCLLVTVFMFTVANGQDPCLVARFAMEECIESANIDFDRLDNEAYKPELCSGAQPVTQCVAQHRGDCPNIPTFRGKSGRVIRRMLASLSQICVEGHSSGEPNPPPGRRCGGNNRRFRRKMRRCHRPLQMNLKEDQMCKPMQKVVKCMRKQLKKFRSCPWMTNIAAQQLQFGADYFNAIRVVRYSCE